MLRRIQMVQPTPISSCPDLIRASMEPAPAERTSVDGWVKPGHDGKFFVGVYALGYGFRCRGRHLCYSITSSARARTAGGTVRPSAFAALILITSSNLVGCSIGMSEGFAPRRILSTNAAARSKLYRITGP